MTRRTFDLPLEEPSSPCRGDLMIGPRLIHEVLDARPVDSRLWANRWSLEVRAVTTVDELDPRLGVYALLGDGCRTWYWRRYRRGERPAEFFETFQGGAELGEGLAISRCTGTTGDCPHTDCPTGRHPPDPSAPCDCPAPCEVLHDGSAPGVGSAP